MKLAFIGRFQPFHLGHLHAIEQFENEHEIDVVIANEKSRTQENPLDFEERHLILGECLDQEIFTQQNFPEDDKKWSRKIIEKTGCEGVITRNSRTREAIEENTDLEIMEQEYKNRDIYSGTEIRRRIRSGEEWRYLVPDCALESLEEKVSVIKDTGIQYEFEPGWKKENAKR